ncbi:MAG: ferredoxin [Paracoccaceae bacterium]
MAAQTSYAELSDAARAVHLDIAGAFFPTADDGCPDGTQTLVLLSPLEPGFWATFSTSPERSDGVAEPLDRWSKRVIGQLAKDHAGEALFPFGGPPYQPFLRWASLSGRAWGSPVGLLVHDTAGLFISFRGALALRTRLDIPAAPESSPCRTCATRPCIAACPVGALGQQGYDVPACRAYISGKSGADCVDNGCAVRRACPVSQSYGRLPEQSAFHMRAFR